MKNTKNLIALLAYHSTCIIDVRTFCVTSQVRDGNIHDARNGRSVTQDNTPSEYLFFILNTPYVWPKNMCHVDVAHNNPNSRETHTVSNAASTWHKQNKRLTYPRSRRKVSCFIATALDFSQLKSVKPQNGVIGDCVGRQQASCAIAASVWHSRMLRSSPTVPHQPNVVTQTTLKRV